MANDEINTIGNSKKMDVQLLLKVGDKKKVTITKIGSKGDGIATLEGGIFVIVPKGELQETYNIVITNVTKKFAFGRIEYNDSENF